MKITDWIGYNVGWQKWDYTWKDVALYALAVGAGKDELRYTYCMRDDFRAIPTFALAPSFMNNFITPAAPLDCRCPGLIMQEAFKGNGLDWDEELEIYRPIDAAKGTLLWDYTIEDILDRGEGKGVVACNVMNLYDGAGRKLAKSINRTAMFSQGGFGGTPVPKSEVVFPDREPDLAADDFVDRSMHMIYVLATNSVSGMPIHIDEDYCRSEAHQSGIVVQGHLVLGLACRHLVQHFARGDDSAVTKITCQFRNPVFPETQLSVLAWEVEKGKVYYKVVDRETGKPYLNNCIFTYKQ